MGILKYIYLLQEDLRVDFLFVDNAVQAHIKVRIERERKKSNISINSTGGCSIRRKIYIYPANQIRGTGNRKEH